MKRPQRLRAVAALDRTIRRLAIEVERLTCPSKPGRRPKGWRAEVEVLVGTLGHASESLERLITPGEAADAIGFTVDGPESDGAVADDHGQDVDNDHDAEMPAARRLGFAV